MYDHIGLRVGNLDASVRFYTAALAPLGFVLCSRDDSGAGFGPKGAPALWLHLHWDRRGQRRMSRSPPRTTRRSSNSMLKA
jgi:catechol 2,3-dioxygenase-like lactoylglutathione lyase family enzyme